MMGRPKLLGVLLVISWTLNVALIVALYYNHRRPPLPPPFAMAPHARGEFPGQPSPLPFEHFEDFRNSAKPMMSRQKELADELLATLLADELDTQKVRRISDSLGNARYRMQSMMLDHVISLRDQLSPEERKRVFPKIVGKLGAEGRHGHRDWKKSKNRTQSPSHE